MSPDEFGSLLAHTISWCAPRANLGDPRHCLRSAALKPLLLARDRDAAVRMVAAKRKNQFLSLPTPRAATSWRDLAGGRLLVCFPDDGFLEAASEAASHGFFDEEDVPPWDTWISVGAGPRQPVLSWVPPMFLGHAEAGIQVSSTACLAWLEDAPVGSLDDELRAFHVRAR